VKRQKWETRTRKKARIGSRATALSEEGRNQQESHQGKNQKLKTRKSGLRNWIQKSKKREIGFRKAEKRENDDL